MNPNDTIKSDKAGKLAAAIRDRATAETRPMAHVDVDSVNAAALRLMTASPDLLAACRLQHAALDHLLAVMIEKIPGFMPTKSVAWPAVEAGWAAIRKATEARS